MGEREGGGGGVQASIRGAWPEVDVSSFDFGGREVIDSEWTKILLNLWRFFSSYDQ